MAQCEVGVLRSAPTKMLMDTEVILTTHDGQQEYSVMFPTKPNKHYNNDDHSDKYNALKAQSSAPITAGSKLC